MQPAGRGYRRAPALALALSLGAGPCATRAAEGTDPPAADEIATQVDSIWARILGPSAGRHQARQELRALGSPALPYILLRKDSPDWSERWELVNALGNAGDPAAADPLVERIVKDSDLHVRWRALWALSAVRNPVSPDKLAAYLEHESRDYRWRAAVGLAFFSKADGLALLKQGLASADRWERWEAVNALGRVFDDTCSGLLLPLVEDPDPGIRREVVMSLGRIGDGPALAALQKLLDHPDPELRWRAASGLGARRAVAAHDKLRARLAVEQDERVRREIQRALGSLGLATPPAPSPARRK